MSDWIKATKKPENDTNSQPARTTEEKIDFFYEVAVTGLSLVAAYYSAKLISHLVFGPSSIGSPYDETSGYYYENNGKRKNARLHAKLRKLRLNSYERMLIQDVVDPEEISTSFSHVGGLTDVKKKLREMIIYPMKHPDIFIQKSSLYSPPRGVLLYGRPGCGKTMLAKCLAKESGAFFINVRVSSICDKWFGESEKKVRALFSLARKLSPCIIFVDEIEVFLKARESMSNEPVMDKVKSEFLIEWDGLVTDCKATGKSDVNSNKKKNKNNNEKSDARRSIVPFNVLVLGATNRPGDVDEAFVRRMPRSFKVVPPNENARRIILYNILSRELEHDTIKDLNFQEIGKLYQSNFPLENHFHLTSV